MANNFEHWEQQLNGNPKAQQFKALANSPEGQRLAQQLDGKAVEQAARSGDAAALKQLLGQILSTPDGKALAKRLEETMKEK